MLKTLARKAVLTNIYFIKCGDAVKIGRAVDVRKKLSILRQANPNGVELLGVLYGVDPAIELRLHAQFDAARQGGEWFRITPEITKYISANCRGALADHRSMRPRKDYVRMTVDVPPDLRDRIKRTARSRGVTLRTLIEAGLEAALKAA